MSSLINYLKGSYIEFKEKVEWPKWDFLQSSTMIVAVAAVILALFTFGVDSLFSVSIKNILGFFINLFN